MKVIIGNEYNCLCGCRLIVVLHPDDSATLRAIMQRATEDALPAKVLFASPLPEDRPAILYCGNPHCDNYQIAYRRPTAELERWIP